MLWNITNARRQNMRARRGKLTNRRRVFRRATVVAAILDGDRPRIAQGDNNSWFLFRRARGSTSGTAKVLLSTESTELESGCDCFCESTTNYILLLFSRLARTPGQYTRHCRQYQFHYYYATFRYHYVSLYYVYFHSYWYYHCHYFY